jgi:hypothetical protein
VPFKYLAQVSQRLASCKLDDVLHMASSGGDAPGLHLQILVTCADIYGDFTTFGAMLRELATHVLRAFRNTKLNCDSIEHLGESIFVDAIGGDPVVGHLTYKGTRLA